MDEVDAAGDGEELSGEAGTGVGGEAAQAFQRVGHGEQRGDTWY